MAEPFLGEIKMLSFGWPPKGWAKCDGTLMPINENNALFSLLSTTFGGDGTSTFALPDMRGRTPLHPGCQDGEHDIYYQGQFGGFETVTLNNATMPVHTHTFYATNTSGTKSYVPNDNTDTLANATTHLLYRSPSNLHQMNAATSSFIGGGQSHNNLQPSLVINFVISLIGTYPSRN